MNWYTNFLTSLFIHQVALSLKPPNVRPELADTNVQVALPPDLLHYIENHGTSKKRMNIIRYLEMLTFNSVTQRDTPPAIANPTVASNPPSISLIPLLVAPLCKLSPQLPPSIPLISHLLPCVVTSLLKTHPDSPPPHFSLPNLTTNPLTKPGSELSTISFSKFSIAGSPFFP